MLIFNSFLLLRLKLFSKVVKPDHYCAINFDLFSKRTSAKMPSRSNKKNSNSGARKNVLNDDFATEALAGLKTTGEDDDDDESSEGSLNDFGDIKVSK